jgi:hypothetical protein
MSKRISLSVAKPRIEAPVEDWIKDRNGHENGAPPEPTVRLTFDIPKSMHKRLKQGSLDREGTIADILREMIAKEFPG